MILQVPLFVLSTSSLKQSANIFVKITDTKSFTFCAYSAAETWG